MPLAAHAVWDGDTLTLDAAWGDVDGVSPLVRVRGSALVLESNQARVLGEQVAHQLQQSISQQRQAVYAS